MDTKDAIQSAMDISMFVLNTYLSDLSHEDLMRRPSEGCNHLAWQLGHLISSEVYLLKAICPDQEVNLPEGFAEQHSKDTANVDDPAAFCSKDEYLQVFQQVRSATLEALRSLPDQELDGPSPEQFRQHFPTVGQMFTLIGTHPMMHAGQFAVVRRRLGKPVLI
jgi:hypothetical protein